MCDRVLTPVWLSHGILKGTTGISDEATALLRVLSCTPYIHTCPGLVDHSHDNPPLRSSDNGFQPFSSSDPITNGTRLQSDQQKQILATFKNNCIHRSQRHGHSTTDLRSILHRLIPRTECRRCAGCLSYDIIVLCWAAGGGGGAGGAQSLSPRPCLNLRPNSKAHTKQAKLAIQDAYESTIKILVERRDINIRLEVEKTCC
ncbi:hypothetical protein EJ02DRAFT_456761 [Clathrospora elynae]|uniref:Uncharacterized protein n=1 Tax=Clathrospora elynae TaxID=706981 RepID=A0A6A5SJ07_9PLEO|nr:hypothetical protein EJ02DRAFT_456761 [Clathrospora elynae]